MSWLAQKYSGIVLSCESSSPAQMILYEAARCPKTHIDSFPGFQGEVAEDLRRELKNRITSAPGRSSPMTHSLIARCHGPDSEWEEW